MHNNNISKGILYKLLNLNTFCLLSLVLHKIGSALPTPVIFCILNILGLMFVMPFVFKKLNAKWLKHNFKSFVLRGLFNNVGLYTWLMAMRFLGPNEATAISFSIPIFTLLLSAVFCNDKLSSRIFITIGLCVLGGFITIMPKINMEFTIIGVIVATISAISWAGYDITCKLQSSDENVISQSFKNYLYSGFISILFLPLYWQQIQGVDVFLQVSNNFNMIFLAAVLSALNIAVLFLAYSSTKVSHLMPISYLRLFFMSVYTYLIFGQIIALSTVIGGTIIFLANMLNYISTVNSAKQNLKSPT